MKSASHGYLMTGGINLAFWCVCKHKRGKKKEFLKQLVNLVSVTPTSLLITGFD